MSEKALMMRHSGNTLTAAPYQAVSALSVAVLAGALAWAEPAQAQQPRAGTTNSPLTSLGENSKDPIKIDADRLDVLDKESKAIFAGNVVAVQGKTTIRCSKMTIIYDSRGQSLSGQAGRPAAAAPAPASVGGDGGIKRLECDGPVTVTSDDQVATGRKAVFDREKDQVIMSGDVALAKGQNVTRGERLVYNTKTGIANFDGGRVRGFFVPGSVESTPPARTRPPGATN
ncbi:MAG: organic solvent tolerance protein OstA [Beijerinckiaceae bacterium]|nr:organic solvent tolerance protein OstA [Beijerinckiaceae bacterium]